MLNSIKMKIGKIVWIVFSPFLLKKETKKANNKFTVGIYLLL